MKTSLAQYRRATTRMIVASVLTENEEALISVFIGCLVEQIVSFEFLTKPAESGNRRLAMAGSIYIIVLIMGGKSQRTRTAGWEGGYP
jgi:hypothetical protein